MFSLDLVIILVLQETTKSTQVEQSEVEHMEDVVPAATGPVESSESDDDEKRWSQFRSDL